MGTFVEPTGRLALNGTTLEQMVRNAEVPSYLHHRLCQVADQSAARSSFIQVSLNSKEGQTPPRDTGGQLYALTFAYTTVYIVRYDDTACERL
jgi:hypothetical protein